MDIRDRRLRKTEQIRNLVKEVTIDIEKLVYPLFIQEGENIKEEITAMPGQFRFSIDQLKEELEEINSLGIKCILLFGIPQKKDSCGSEAYNKNGIIQKSIKFIKEHYSDIVLITDVCMCEYTSHGHCGILKGVEVDNDLTLEYLANIAISHAEAGADIVAPSDMMDGRVGYIRKKLDEAGFIDTIIMAYSVKYASAFYGPFREAAGSVPEFGDRRGYQMDCRRIKEAIKEAEQDIKEGADIVMVKPGLAYLDVVNRLSDKVKVPIAVYNVSAEYSMLKAAAINGWIDEKRVVLEEINSFFRAGADIVITYHAKEVAKWIKGF